VVSRSSMIEHGGSENH